MLIIATIVSAIILFIAFYLLNSMPKMPPRALTNYEDYFMDVSERIASIKEPKHISTAEHVRLQFEDKFKTHPTVRRDSQMLQTQIEVKKRMLGGGVWLCLILSLNVNAQYAGVSVLNKGIGVTAGILANKVNIQAALTFPIVNLENANTYSLTAGYQVNLTNDEKDNYSFTPSIGAALVRSRTWNEKAAMTTNDNIKPIYGAELGKDAYMGRVFLQANYLDKVMYYGLGMKVFFNR